MWAKRSFKAAQILVTLTLVIASTLLFVQSNGGRLIYSRYAQSEPPKMSAPPPSVSSARDTASVASTAATPRAGAEKNSLSPGQSADGYPTPSLGNSQPATGPTYEAPIASTRVVPSTTTGTAPRSSTTVGAAVGSSTTGSAAGSATSVGSAAGSSATTGSSTTTGAAGQTVGAAKSPSTPTYTTGAAGPIPDSTATVVVRGYEGHAADARLKLVLSDLRSDLRKSVVEIPRSPPKSALQSAMDALGRSQERTDLLIDIARDVDFGSKSEPRRSGQADAPDNHATTGLVKIATAATSLPMATPPAVGSNGSPWLEPAVLLAVMGVLIASMIAWFGDNWREKIFGSQTTENVPGALAAPAALRQIEQQPPLSGPTEMSAG